MRILIASPVHQRLAVLRLFLKSLKGLEHGEHQVGYRFADNNDSDEARELLREFEADMPEVSVVTYPTVVYERDEVTHRWNDELVDNVASMKDDLLDYARTEQVDALFLVDSDVLLYPDTLLRLLAADQEIVSNIFWTRWQPESDPLPQVWLMDEYSFEGKKPLKRSRSGNEGNAAAAFLEKMRTPGLYEVGGLGACTLIRRSALEKGVSFRRLRNLSFWGEDRHFCVRAAALGIPLYVDTRNPAFHVYRESDLPAAEAFLDTFPPSKKPSITISLCMIVRDEEEALASCLESVHGIADEIVIVDTGSTDRTKEIARRYTDRIVDYTWHDDFAAARNHAFGHATKEYVLWLDADDRILEEDRQAFLRLKEDLDPGVDSVMMPYVLMRDAKGNPTSSLKRNRLVKRSKGFRWIGPVHEYLEVSGRIEHREIKVTHGKQKPHTDRNLRIYRSREERGEVFSARDQFYFANELRDHGLLEEAIGYYEQFLAGGCGWVEDVIASCHRMADCYKRLGKRDERLRSLFRAMKHDRPRAETCCGLGEVFFEEGKLEQAIYWYELATILPKPADVGGLLDHAAWSWLPYLQLCLCYDKLGDYQKADEMNEAALARSPEHPSMLFNRTYFDKRLGRCETPLNS
ncbi:glycosyltransferase [Gorillibacterium sp. CAU 1737]|uniref:glycosyltransferase n=1 Tax=Gorillibacterium sp. CAU 1737 TaxID=3140362 RepID=UPI0032614208